MGRHFEIHPFETNSVGYFEDGDSGFLTILNNSQPSLNIYDYKTKKLVDKIVFDIDGPNGIKKTGDNISHLMCGNGHIYILNSWISKLFIFGENGTFLKQVSLWGCREKFSANVYSNSTHPMKMIKNDLYIPLYAFSPSSPEYDYTEIPTYLKLDLSAESFEPVFNLPDTYNSHFWGLHTFKYWSNFVFNQKEETYVLNFSIDPYLYVYKNGRLPVRHFISSKYFDHIPPLLDEIPKSPIADLKSKDREYAMTNPDFNLFIFDERSQIYIRMVYLRPTVDDYKSGATLPHFSFILFDNSFNKIGETKLNGGVYRPDISFWNGEGLHIARYDKFARDENALTFGVFKVLKN